MSVGRDAAPYKVYDDDSQVKNDMQGDLGLVDYLFGL